MKKLYKYLLLLVLAGILIWGGQRLQQGTLPNIEVVVHNNSGKSLDRIQLKTDKTGKDLLMQGIDTGFHMEIQFHNDGVDQSHLFLRFQDGSETTSEPVTIQAGDRIVLNITDRGIDTERSRMTSTEK